MSRLNGILGGLSSGPLKSRHPVVTALAILTVVGVLPAVVIGLGPVVVSTAVLAVVWLLARRFGVTPR